METTKFYMSSLVFICLLSTSFAKAITVKNLTNKEVGLKVDHASGVEGCNVPRFDVVPSSKTEIDVYVPGSRYYQKGVYVSDALCEAKALNVQVLNDKGEWVTVCEIKKDAAGAELKELTISFERKAGKRRKVYSCSTIYEEQPVTPAMGRIELPVD